MIDTLPLAPVLVHALGWTIVHSVWQASLIAVCLFTALRLGVHAPHTRYAASCLALAAMLAAPALTFTLTVHGQQASLAAPPVMASAAGGPARADAAASTSINPTRLAGTDAASVAGASGASAAESSNTSTTSLERVRIALDAALPTLVGLWICGLALGALRIGGGWWRAARLRSLGTVPLPAEWTSRITQLARRIGLLHPLIALQSTAVDSPSVVGWLRPVVLVPAAALTGLSRDQLEAVLLHELAHIRRHDYLVNLAQVVAETVLFYHPAVWLVSRRIRVEREHCCDDLAVEACGDAVTYASALAELERLRLVFAPTLALAAARGPLLRRVLRILDAKPPRPAQSGGIVSIAAACCLAGPVGLFAWAPAAPDTTTNGEPILSPRATQPAPATTRRRAITATAATPASTVDPASREGTVQAAPTKEPSTGAAAQPTAALPEPSRARDSDDDWPPPPPPPPAAPGAPGPPVAVIAPPAPQMVPPAAPTPRTPMAAPRPPTPATPPEPPEPPSQVSTGNAADAGRAIGAGRPADPDRPADHRRTSSPGRPANPDRTGSPGRAAGSTGTPVPPAQSDSLSMSSRSGEYNVDWRHGGERLIVRGKGDIEVADDDTRITRIVNGDRLDIEERVASGSSRVEIRAGLDDTVTARWFKDGHEAPFEPEGRAWLARRLPDILRRTGLAARARVARIHARSGVAGVLSEVSRIESDFVKTRYLRRLLDATSLDAAALTRLVDQAGQSVRSDFELASLLTRVLETTQLTDATIVAIVGATASIDSDFEQRRVLGTVVERPTVSATVVADVVRSARQINSDFELATLLVALMERHGAAGLSEPGFVETASTLQSDFERARVLIAAVEQPGLTDEQVGTVLQNVRPMRSDFERARVLTTLADRQRLTEATRQAYVAVAETLRSSHERDRALARLALSARR